MPDGFVQVAPDSTGAKMHTRERVVGADTLEEPYLIILPSDRVVSSRVWCASLRTPTRAIGTAAVMSQPMFTVWNGGTNPINLRRLVVESDSIVGKAQYSPWLRLYRIAAAPTGGTVVPWFQQDTTDTSINANVVARVDAQTDGAIATTPLAATPNPASSMWSQTVPRWPSTTAANISGMTGLPVMNMLPDDGKLMQEDPLTLRANQGILIRCEAISAVYALADWTFHFKAVVAEYTNP